ncbi:hypothetical protein [Roseofilum casamattae]|uniref:HNH endonuclease n=1 Tax=Roseofilum casamattae BLCC-M143 TaxID=3022442 RepID=A0ABT7BTJ2_9CYAN|nr:hypothetical protein [Roseofilum casamattae]MDJ1182499.1 HNH endonuclease [Roseofilum casamattae BLCC-M143]
MTSRYPQDWQAIATRVKEDVGWRCSKCGMQCIKPGEKVPGLSRKERKARTLQVHHSDYNPANSDLSNLIPLCSACHLSFHRGRKGNISPGQLSLFS